VDLGPFAYRAFALKLAEAPLKLPAPRGQPVDLPFDLSAASATDGASHGGFDDQGESYPAEEFPQNLTLDSIPFRLGPADGKNALVCHGQRITLPADLRCDHVHVLAAAVDADQAARFKLDDQITDCTIEQWNSRIGQWDRRIWKHPIPQIDFEWSNPWVGLEPAFIKRAQVAWYSNHRHDSAGANEYYQYCYLFHYTLDAPAGGARALTLPDNPRIRIFAVTAAAGSHDQTRPARPLFDIEPRDDALAAPTITPGGGKFADVVRVSLGHPLYWNAAELHYTMDASHPTNASPVYDGPIDLDGPATIKACFIDESGQAGPLASARFDVNDVTPPRVISVLAVEGLPSVSIAFSKALRPESARDAKQFRFDPDVAVQSVSLADDGRAIELRLDQPIAAGARSLMVADVRDRSPASNQIQATPLTFQTLAPVYTQPNGVSGQREIKVAGLPTKAGDAWTLNLFCRPDGQIPSQTVVAGFGRADDSKTGTGRYLTNFPRGLHFWSSNQDVDSSTPIDAGRWQMLSATYDGEELRLFKDGRQVAHGPVALTDDESTVRFAPADPWTYKNVFAGQIHQLTIWNAALPPNVVAALYEAKKDQP
jgi:alpha-mannosidase